MLLDIFRHSNSLLHDMGPGHFEAPHRIKIIERALEHSDLGINYLKAAAATKKEINKIHSDDLFNLVKASQSRGGHRFTPDTIANEYTYQAALTAVGGSLQTVVNLHRNHSFAMLRPPGHHATYDSAMGFCFFNNIAIAAKHLSDLKKKKIAIIDIDNHHGNGTQDLFYNNPDILYMSLHAAPDISFPGTGYYDEIGVDDGEGYTVNIPLPYKTNDDDYLFAFNTIIDPILRQFKPNTILVSLGLDGLLNDPYGVLGLSIRGFEELGHRIGRINNSLTKQKVGTFLEGGYDYENIGEATVRFFDGLINPEKFTKKILNPSKTIQRIVHHVRSIHRNYWYAI